MNKSDSFLPLREDIKLIGCAAHSFGVTAGPLAPMTSSAITSLWQRVTKDRIYPVPMKNTKINLPLSQSFEHERFFKELLINKLIMHGVASVKQRINCAIGESAPPCFTRNLLYQEISDAVKVCITVGASFIGTFSLENRRHMYVSHKGELLIEHHESFCKGIWCGKNTCCKLFTKEGPTIPEISIRLRERDHPYNRVDLAQQFYRLNYEQRLVLKSVFSKLEPDLTFDSLDVNQLRWLWGIIEKKNLNMPLFNNQLQDLIGQETKDMVKTLPCAWQQWAQKIIYRIVKKQVAMYIEQQCPPRTFFEMDDALPTDGKEQRVKEELNNAAKQFFFENEQVREFFKAYCEGPLKDLGEDEKNALKDALWEEEVYEAWHARDDFILGMLSQMKKINHREISKDLAQKLDKLLSMITHRVYKRFIEVLVAEARVEHGGHFKKSS